MSDGVQIREKWSYVEELMEEADNRDLLHINDVINCGLKRILFKTLDSDIVAILLAFMGKLFECHAEIKLWVKFSSGLNERLANLNSTCN